MLWLDGYSSCRDSLTRSMVMAQKTDRPKLSICVCASNVTLINYAVPTPTTVFINKHVFHGRHLPDYFPVCCCSQSPPTHTHTPWGPCHHTESRGFVSLQRQSNQLTDFRLIPDHFALLTETQLCHCVCCLNIAARRNVVVDVHH